VSGVSHHLLGLQVGQHFRFKLKSLDTQTSQSNIYKSMIRETILEYTNLSFWNGCIPVTFKRNDSIQYIIVHCEQFLTTPLISDVLNITSPLCSHI
jgi:hypothetical protein